MLALKVSAKLPEMIIADVTHSLTHTLVGSLSRAMSNFNHMQAMCRRCAIDKTRCSDCAYVQYMAKRLTGAAAHYSHYYSKYYSKYYAPIATKMKVPEMKKLFEEPPEGGDE